MKFTNISLYLDTRRQKKDGTYPVKLQVWNSMLHQRKHFGTGVDLTEKDFNAAMDMGSKKKPTDAVRSARKALDQIMNKGRDVAETLKPFSWDEFERQLFTRTVDQDDLFHALRLYYAECMANNQFGTAGNTTSAYVCILNFLDWKRGKKIRKHDRSTVYEVHPTPLRFSAITIEWLKQFATFITDVQGSSRTTAGIRCITIRTMFGRNPSIKAIHYPFGKDKFRVPNSANNKIALYDDEISLLAKAKVDASFRTTILEKAGLNPDERIKKGQTAALQKAKDFFFFSYDMNGANISDVLLLQWKNIDFDAETIQWVRKKTEETTEREKVILAFFTPHILKCLKKYGSELKQPDDYVFPFVTKQMNEEQSYRTRRNFGNWLNKNIQTICVMNGLKKVVARSARHSWATSAINAGASLGHVRDGLGHTNSATTDRYISGLPTNAARKLAQKITRR